MKKRIITGLAALTSMVSSAAAQDIYRTAANVPMVQLNNGILMPQFGLGTFFQPSDPVCEQSCLTALKAGYRHIDTAHAYNDEAGVGRAVKESGIPYIIYRPTGYFYDIVHVLKPMVEKGAIRLLGKTSGVANVIATEDFAEYIVSHLGEENRTISIGGKETYTYDEMAKICFDAVGKPCVIKRAPAWLFDVLIWINTMKKTGKADIIKFSKFTLVGNLVGDVSYGKQSFREYLTREIRK